MSRHAPPRRLVGLYGVTFGGFLNLQLLIAVVPILASRTAGSTAAGLSTASLFMATVLTQASMPFVLSRASHRLTLAIGLLLLGLPTIAYVIPAAWAVLAASVIRGVGFGIVAVVCTALVAAYAPEGSRGSSFGRYGLLLGSLAIVGPPLGLFLVHGGSPFAVVVIGCGAPLLALPMISSLSEPPVRSVVGPDRYRGALSLESVAPLATFLASTFGYGAVVSSLPLLFPASAALAILLMGVALTVARTLAGRLADRVVDARLLAPAVGVAALGCVAVWWSAQGAGLGWLLVGTLTFGTGLGALTTLSYVLLTRQATGGSFVLASTVWNLAYDGGIGLGGLALAAMAGLGVPVIYLATLALLTLTLPLALRRSRIH